MTVEPPDLAATPDPAAAATRSSSSGSRARSSSAPSSPSRSRSSRRRRRWPTCCTRAPSALILFHIVARGTCWVAGDDGERHWAEVGDVIVLPYGDHHVIGGASPGVVRAHHRRCSTRCRGATCRPSATAAAATAVDLVCGYLVSDDPLFDPALRVFPSAFVVRLPDGATARLGAGERRLRRDRERAVEREPEPGRRRACPSWCSSRCCATTSPRRRPPTTDGWQRCTIRSSRPRSRCCTAIRRAGGRWPSSRPGSRCRGRCSTSGSGRCSAARRSATSPSGACTSPRSCSPPPTSASCPIARRVGYDSEEAFSRAFKRRHGLARATGARRGGAHHLLWVMHVAVFGPTMARWPGDGSHPESPSSRSASPCRAAGTTRTRVRTRPRTEAGKAAVCARPGTICRSRSPASLICRSQRRARTGSMRRSTGCRRTSPRWKTPRPTRTSRRSTR